MQTKKHLITNRIIAITCIVLFSLYIPRICNSIYFSVRYKYSEKHSVSSNFSNHTIKVYRDTWHWGMPGSSSDAPCVVKLIDNNTGKCLHMAKFDMLQNVRNIKFYKNSVKVDVFTEWFF